jgi:hypothetical protein
MIHIYIYLYIYLYVFIYTVHIFVFVYIYVYMYIYMCKYIYYIYTHAHMHDYSFLCPEWLIPQFGMIYMFLGVRVLGWYHGPWVIFFGIGSLVIIGDRFFWFYMFYH